MLLVETNEPVLRERTEQLLMDGYAVDAVSVIDQARVKLADGPDALVLSSGPDTIGLLRQLRDGEISRADSRVRQKLDRAGAEPIVQTVFGVGWRLT